MWREGPPSSEEDQGPVHTLMVHEMECVEEGTPVFRRRPGSRPHSWNLRPGVKWGGGGGSLTPDSLPLEWVLLDFRTALDKELFYAAVADMNKTVPTKVKHGVAAFHQSLRVFSSFSVFPFSLSEKNSFLLFSFSPFLRT